MKSNQSKILTPYRCYPRSILYYQHPYSNNNTSYSILSLVLPVATIHFGTPIVVSSLCNNNIKKNGAQDASRFRRPRRCSRSVVNDRVFRLRVKKEASTKASDGWLSPTKKHPSLVKSNRSNIPGTPGKFCGSNYGDRRRYIIL